ncbi:MAG: hypothetical protein ACK421_07700 [Pseudanabaenaceae cyanobacterium]
MVRFEVNRKKFLETHIYWGKPTQVECFWKEYYVEEGGYVGKTGEVLIRGAGASNWEAWVAGEEITLIPFEQFVEENPLEEGVEMFCNL